MNNLLFKLIRLSGLPWLFREWVQGRKVTIWMLHDLDRAAAEQVLPWLSQHYNIISLEQYVAACEAGNAAGLPSKAAILTFDDGHRGNYRLLSLFKKFGIQPTIFLCSGLVGSRRHYWFLYEQDELSTTALKALPNTERLRQLETVGFYPEQEYETAQALDQKQINAMKPAVDFQAHTVFHPCLPQCDGPEAWAEIEGSKAQLEASYGLNIYALAYPNGDYTPREVEMAKRAGYRCALTVEPGYNGLNTDLFRLKRFSLNDTDNMDELIVKASGCWGLFKKLLKGA